MNDHCVVMALEPNDVVKLGEPPIWKEFEAILRAQEGQWVKLTQCERMAFYQRAKRAFAVVHTSEKGRQSRSLHDNFEISSSAVRQSHHQKRRHFFTKSTGGPHKNKAKLMNRLNCALL